MGPDLRDFIISCVHRSYTDLSERALLPVPIRIDEHFVRSLLLVDSVFAIHREEFGIGSIKEAGRQPLDMLAHKFATMIVLII